MGVGREAVTVRYRGWDGVLVWYFITIRGSGSAEGLHTLISISVALGSISAIGIYSGLTALANGICMYIYSSIL